MMDAALISGRILHLQRLSTEDGPGIRTTVFFKGCPLHCAWCHNPESLSPKVQIQWYAARCIGCNTCLGVCPNGNLNRDSTGLIINRANCQGCVKCAQSCPAQALEALGKTVNARELLRELLKDKVYFEKSSGGVTLSGGEPTLQPDFAHALLHGLQESGIHTALDTCGFCNPSVLDRLLPHTDLVLFDLKMLHAEEHLAWTGQSNQQIITSLLTIRNAMRSSNQPKELWVRTPLIPGANLSPTKLHEIGRFLASELNGCVTRWELCAFNNLCRDKYLRLGMEWAFADQGLLTPRELSECELAARSSGIVPEIVFATGPTCLSEN